MELDDGFLLGLTAGFGRQNFTSGNGTGDSDDLMIGVYARKDAGPFMCQRRLRLWLPPDHHLAGCDRLGHRCVFRASRMPTDFGGRAGSGMAHCVE